MRDELAQLMKQQPGMQGPLWLCLPSRLPCRLRQTLLGGCPRYKQDAGVLYRAVQCMRDEQAEEAQQQMTHGPVAQALSWLQSPSRAAH